MRDRLDSLIAAHDAGVRGAEHYDQLEADAQAIARDLIAAFRRRRDAA